MGERGAGPTARPRRAPLNRGRIVTAAMELADEKGSAGVTMRATAARLGVEAMSLYNHVTGREDILDGMVDAVFAEIDLPSPQANWKTAMRARASSCYRALRRHPWAVGLLDSRGRPGSATLRHHDAVLGALRTGGFSVSMATHAVSLIDSYLYGFVIQERSLPFVDAAGFDGGAEDSLRDLPADTYPYLAEAIAAQADEAGHDHGEGFEFGLTLILDGLEPDGVSASRTDRGGRPAGHHGEPRPQATPPARH
ncbi:AcrR family transcriptional regulator [Actinoalloteichus hoggarensis]|uniref:Tetracycline repressor protein n=1 Tax=Actinoalloteichus hoggarensis TaxID=1470176 RepID=A0A221W3F1_9PSEU|nr:TetR/AcrR family transcriptional regulator [Actinoalloteichus hoggarensis]ASO20216.1 Tetracycline repressor protein [Actinoalloteichus hoggarensis]MBB5919071.1 AcrR family transcriptional regulator [Actinoalloteichus hoggarensis]